MPNTKSPKNEPEELEISVEVIYNNEPNDETPKYCHKPDYYDRIKCDKCGVTLGWGGGDLNCCGFLCTNCFEEL